MKARRGLLGDRDEVAKERYVEVYKEKKRKLKRCIYQCTYRCSDKRGENGDGEEGREWRLSGLSYANGFSLCGESEEGIMAMVGRLVEVFRRRCLKVNADKSKVMLLVGEEGLGWEVRVHGIGLEHVSGCVLDGSGINGAEFSRKMANGRRVAGLISLWLMLGV